MKNFISLPYGACWEHHENIATYIFFSFFHKEMSWNFLEWNSTILFVILKFL